jgi:ribosomal protein S27AE
MYAQDKEARQREIIAALNSHAVRQPCPRCANMQFDLIGEAVIPLQETPGVYSIGGPGIPVAVVACRRCGFISEHALGSLGLGRGGQ